MIYPWICKLTFEALATSHEFFQYTLRGYLDASPDSPIDGMRYADSPLGNCSVQLLEVSQYLWSPVVDQVREVSNGL